MNGNRIMMAITCLFVSCTMVLVFASGCLAQEAEETTVEHEAGFYYTVQKGDTLWDLSDHFFDSPWLWPELWQENDQIPNPHRIYPGERIRLYQKEGSDTFTLTPPKKEVVVEEAAVEKEMPKEPVEETVYFYYPALDQVGFITKDEIIPLATIFDIKDKQRLVDTGDIVYLSFDAENADKLQRGSLFTVYRRMDPSPDKKINRQYGKQYYIVGKVEITKKEADYVVGLVVGAYREIHGGDFILPYERRSPKIPLVPSTPGIDGKLLIAEEHSKMIGDYTIAFIDKGSEDSILVGQQYHVYHQQEGVKDKKKILYSPIDYAKFIVLHTEKNVSTVLMTQTDVAVEPGASFRTPVE